MNIQKHNFKQELWKYGSFVYVGVAFLLLTFMGLVEGISNQKIVEMILWGFFTLTWGYIMYDSIRNIFFLTKAIYKNEEYTKIKEVILVTSITQRTINSREFKLILLFVTILYTLPIIMTIIEKY